MRSVTGSRLGEPSSLVSEDAEHGIVELHCSFGIADAESHMTEHEHLPPRRPTVLHEAESEFGYIRRLGSDLVPWSASHHGFGTVRTFERQRERV